MRELLCRHTRSLGPFDEAKGSLWARRRGSACLGEKCMRYKAARNHGHASWVASDSLGEQFHTHATSVARFGVDAKHEPPIDHVVHSAFSVTKARLGVCGLPWYSRYGSNLTTR